MILKLTDKQGINHYLRWSEAVDAPANRGFGCATEETLDSWAKKVFPEYSDEYLQTAILRARENSASWSETPVDIDSFVLGNRAGENETELSVDEIISRYCH